MAAILILKKNMEVNKIVKMRNHMKWMMENKKILLKKIMNR